jgi:hypothetical protein
MKKSADSLMNPNRLQIKPRVIFGFMTESADDLMNPVGNDQGNPLGAPLQRKLLYMMSAVWQEIFHFSLRVLSR